MSGIKFSKIVLIAQVVSLRGSLRAPKKTGRHCSWQACSVLPSTKLPAIQVQPLFSDHAGNQSITSFDVAWYTVAFALSQSLGAMHCIICLLCRVYSDSLASCRTVVPPAGISTAQSHAKDGSYFSWRILCLGIIALQWLKVCLWWSSVSFTLYLLCVILLFAIWNYWINPVETTLCGDKQELWLGVSELFHAVSTPICPNVCGY